MKASEYISKILKQHNIKKMFGYIGGYNADILEYFCEDKHNQFVLNYNEQASSFAINGYSAIAEQVAVATSSGAPSSCNLVPGIANAYFDSNPCLFLVGSSHSLACRENKSIRQNAFEEIDMVAMVSDITKYAVRITDVKNIRYELEKAFYIANEGRKGPVLVDIPYNIAREEINPQEQKAFVPESTKYDDFEITEVISLLNNAKKPVILLGGGTRSKKTRTLLKQLLDKVQIPCVSSLCGLDTLSHNNQSYVGFIGHYGNRYANLALANADLVFVLGSRLDERQLGGYKSRLEKNCKLIRVEIDKAEIGRKLFEDISIYNTVENFLEKLAKEDLPRLNFDKWHNIINAWKKRYSSVDLNSKETNANNFLHIISDYLPSDAIITADVGQNQMCVAQALKLDNQMRLLNSAGYGSMGFSLPAAIGASYANPNAAVISVNGDGGIQMNIQELQTIKRDNLPVNVVILNNNCLGMIRKTQEKLFNGKTFVSVDDYSVPDFEAIANAYKIDYLLIDSVEKYNLFENFISKEHPTVIELALSLEMQNYPEPGTVIDMQDPVLCNEEYDKVKQEAQNV